MNVWRAPPGSLALLLAVAAAHAGDATAVDQSSSQAHLDEIIVTAQRREQRLQDVPISATVLNAQQLERQQIDNVSALQFAAPAMHVAPSQSTSTSASISLRGHFENDTTPTVDPAVGLYLDGVYIARTLGANLLMVDVERVEVLRGPQGTTFGRNTIGGAIHLISRQPDAEIAVESSAKFGNYSLIEVRGMLNAPLSTRRAAVRLAAMHSQRDGYARNALLGAAIDSVTTNFARLQLRIDPTDNSEFSLSADITESDTGAQWRTLLALLPGHDGVTAALGNPADSLSNYLGPYRQSVSANRNGGADTSVRGLAATVMIRQPRLSIRSMTAWREAHGQAVNIDQDGTPYDLGVIFLRKDEQRQLSQEVQLIAGTPTDRLQWVGGVYYFQERATFRQRFEMYVANAGAFIENMPWGDVRNRSTAIYAQADVTLSPSVLVTTGVRHIEDRRQLTSFNARRVNDTTTCRLSPDLLDSADVCAATRPERVFAYTPWTVGLSYYPADGWLTYAKLSRGHRAGGYNLRGATEIDLDTFDPESVDSIEIGSKSDLAGDRLRLNLALYTTRFEDIQLLHRESGESRPRFVRNGGRATIRGGEFELSAVLGDLRLAAGFGVVRGSYTHLDPRVEGVTLQSEFLHTPVRSSSLSIDFPFTWRFGKLNLHADYAWRDTVPFSNDPTSPARQHGYSLLNASLSTNVDRLGLELALWARNIGDRDYLLRAWDNGYYVAGAPGSPRTFGIRIDYRFSRQRARHT